MMPCHGKSRHGVFAAKRLLRPRAGMIDLGRMFRVALPLLSILAVFSHVVEQPGLTAVFFRAKSGGKLSRPFPHILNVFL